ncbi:efflux RND transporter periplasmic adaptor subunit [Abyssibacter sp.]|uniref:efflux RND transporter periplasmic adaptor subunit n=1 Tax=Abyssibacter sp. TaxID=2320200 RepID=UPI0025C653B2|nr:efflux RND transporter periplasmic adaptor subunit [Abyssibacter sp.]MCK5860178.1 efflux RND transporter periplasmic adaptor subunit [Abyssibacter sp.]
MKQKYIATTAVSTGLLSVLAVLAGLMLRQDDAQASTPVPPPRVSVANVHVDVVTEWLDYTGRLAAVNHVALRPRVRGQIARVDFTEGDRVQQGDVLFELDSRPYDAALAQANGALVQAQAEHAQALREASRAEALHARQVISDEEAELRRSRLAVAEAAMATAQARLQSARLDVEFTQVRAPVSGQVGRVEITQGNWVTPDGQPLTTIVSTEAFYLDFAVDERAYLRLARNLGDDGVRVRYALSGEEQFDRKGRLSFLDNVVDPGTGTLRLRAVVRNEDGLLRPGLFAKVRLPDGLPEPAVLVNDRAIGTDQGNRYVYVVDQAGTTRYRRVELGPKVPVDGHLLRVVRRGLEPGERVVVAGLLRVQPGATVTPEPVDMGSLARREPPLLSSQVVAAQ